MTPEQVQELRALVTPDRCGVRLYPLRGLFWFAKKGEDGIREVDIDDVVSFLQQYGLSQEQADVIYDYLDNARDEQVDAAKDALLHALEAGVSDALDMRTKA